MKNELISLMADALEKETNDIQLSDKFRDYEEWDSLAVLSMIAMIKQNYDITIPRKDFETINTVEELNSYIQDHKK